MIIRTAFICSLFLIMNLLSGTSNYNDEEILIAPDYLASFYDNYTRNFLNTRALGMGNVSVSLKGGIEYALTNPASFAGGDINVYFEGNAKNEVKEMNKFINIENPDKADERQNLEAGIPAITVGIGHSVSPNISLGASFSIPQTVRYNIFGRMLKTGVYIDRFPTMINYQGILTGTGHLGNINLGLNAILNHYYFSDLRIEYTFDRVTFGETIFRLQPGILYCNDRYSFGLSYKFPTEHTFEVSNRDRVASAPVYHIYEDVVLPGVLDAGVSFNFGADTKLALAAEYEQTSAQFEEFDDRLTLKAGIERKSEDYSLRAGIMKVPGIYSGKHDTIKSLPRIGEEEDPFEFDLDYDYLEVEKTDQLILTGGITYYTPKVDFSVGLARDVLGNIDVFQVSLSFDIKLGEIIRETRQKRTGTQ